MHGGVRTITWTQRFLTCVTIAVVILYSSAGRAPRARRRTARRRSSPSTVANSGVAQARRLTTAVLYPPDPRLPRRTACRTVRQGGAPSAQLERPLRQRVAEQHDRGGAVDQALARTVTTIVSTAEASWIHEIRSMKRSSAPCLARGHGCGRARRHVATSDSEGGAERAPLRATDPVSAVSPKMARSGENGQLDRASSTIANVGLRLGVLTSQNRALNVNLRDLAALHTKTSAGRDALRAARAGRRPSATRCRGARWRWRLATPAGKRSAAALRRLRARIADEHASEAASRVAGAVAVAAEADARANLAGGGGALGKLALAALDEAPGGAPARKKRRRRRRRRRSGRRRDEDVRFGRGTRLRALQLARVKDQHVAALRVGELEGELERAKTAAAVFEARARDAEREKESADEKTAAAFEAVERLRRENDALRVAGAATTGDNVGDDRGRGDVAKTVKTVAAELSALRAAATRLARDAARRRSSVWRRARWTCREARRGRRTGRARRRRARRRSGTTPRGTKSVCCSERGYDRAGRAVFAIRFCHKEESRARRASLDYLYSVAS